MLRGYTVGGRESLANCAAGWQSRNPWYAVSSAAVYVTNNAAGGECVHHRRLPYTVQGCGRANDECVHWRPKRRLPLLLGTRPKPVLSRTRRAVRLLPPSCGAADRNRRSWRRGSKIGGRFLTSSGKESVGRGSGGRVAGEGRFVIRRVGFFRCWYLETCQPKEPCILVVIRAVPTFQLGQPWKNC